MGKMLSKEPGTAGLAFVAVRQTGKDTCESFFNSKGIERTMLSKSNLLAGYFALDCVLRKIKSGDWKSCGIRHVTLVTRSEYLYWALHNRQIFRWQRYDWMVKKEHVIMERPNKDLAAVLYDYDVAGIEMETKFLQKENYPVLNTLIENPISLALQASNGNNLMKDSGFEKIYEGSDQKDSATPL